MFSRFYLILTTSKIVFPRSLPLTDCHQNLLLPYFWRRCLTSRVVFHTLRRPGAFLRARRSLGLPNSSLGGYAGVGTTPLRGNLVPIRHFCLDHHLLGRFVEEGFQTGAKT